MKTVTLFAEWSPRPGFQLGSKDVDKKLTYLGSKVWRHPQVKIVEKDVPEIGPTEVLIRVRACGICGSDVHMLQSDRDGYIFYPGLTAFPCTLGHEFSGEVEQAGKLAVNKRTGKPFEKGEAVTAEEMFWCASCRPCADGQPNHCEALQELGFSTDGAYAPYVKIDSRYIWSIESFRSVYSGDDLFLAGSLVEPTSVAYNAVIERGGGIRPGDNVVILGGGPIGLAACAILRRAGAAAVVLAEPSRKRAELGMRMGATHTVDPMQESTADRVLEITKGQGAKLFLEATGLPERVWGEIERVIWEGREICSVAVVVARADAKMQVTGEVLQVRKASIVGAQGHSGHGNFPRVISAMATGLKMTPIITKKIRLEEVPENLKLLQTDREECKITMIP